MLTPDVRARQMTDPIWRTLFDANREAMERYLAQQSALVELAIRDASAAGRDAIVRHALEANQQVLQALLASNESAVRGWLTTGVIEAAAPEPRDAATAEPPAPAVKADADGPLAARVEGALRAEIARVTGFRPDAVDPTVTFEELGLDSIAMIDVWSAILPDFPQLEPHAGLVFAIRRLGDVRRTIANLENASRRDAEPPPTTPAPTRLAESLRQAIAGVINVEAAGIGNDDDFELDLNLDAFTRERLLRECLAGHPGFDLVGSELLNARSIGDIEALFGRFEPLAGSTAGI